MALLFGFAQRKRVGAVCVARTGGGENLLAGRHNDRLGLPCVVFFDAGDERRVDVVVLAQPDQHRRDEAAVLAHLVHHLVTGPREIELAPDARHLVGLTHTTEQVHVGCWLPSTKARAGTGARGATAAGAETVDTVVEPEFFFQMEGDVLALFVFVPDHVMRASDDATGTAGAQVVGDDLVV